ncbi:MAG TPA: heterodisulfide reductase-related iron-sulfur binding cluster [Candidatus Limnocylindria bacterium]|nr:heterodisulfide reductase-related iron-sulfur binding cluster [Candidatus Limnocylindria bacterium]
MGVWLEARRIVDDGPGGQHGAQSIGEAGAHFGGHRSRYRRDISTQTAPVLTTAHLRAEDLATCISCGLCLNDCPTYRVLGDEADSPRGRIQLIRELATTAGAPDASLVGHLDACLVCRACETACPSGVPFGRIMEGAREVMRERERGGRVARLLRVTGLGMVAHQRRLRFGTRVMDLYVRSGVQRAVRASRLLPRRLASVESLTARAEGPPYVPRERGSADVAFFAGCLMRTAFGETDRATVRMLERAGKVVTSPTDQTCCGALHAHAGEGHAARELARRNVQAFDGSTALIVVNAAGCGAHLKAYGEVLAADPAWAERASAFAKRVRDATEAVPATAVTAGPERPIRVVYQDACHLAHGQQIRREPRALLAAMRNVTVVPIADADRCCGSAGIYNLTHPEVAGELQRQKVQSILSTGPDVIVSGNPGCMLQISAGLRAAGAHIPVVHLMRFLDDPVASLGVSAG